MARLVDAALDEVRASGYEGLTVRAVAKRAGVAPATAYTYFASKDHLVAEVFWQQLQQVEPVAPDGRRAPAGRVADALGPVGRLVAGEPELASACTVAVMADEPNVASVRDQIGAFVHRRLVDALGPDTDPEVVAALDLTWMGAMVLAGTGHLGYDQLAARVATVAGLLASGTGGAR